MKIVQVLVSTNTLSPARDSSKLQRFILIFSIAIMIIFNHRIRDEIYVTERVFRVPVFLNTP